VTGGAGYIGSVVTGQLLGAGHQVIVLDNLSSGSPKAVPPEAKLIVGDISDRAGLNSIFRINAIDAVMHFAAFIEAGESMKAPERYFRNNTAGTLTVLESMLENGVKRFVFSSTAALYGDPQRIPIEEDDELRPTNAYGESKLLVEKMLDWFQRIHGLRYASLRYFNAAGAAGGLGEDHRPESHLIPRVLKVALGFQKSVSIYGTDYETSDGTCIRDYVHVVDLAEAHRLALAALEDRSTLIYNLGNGRGYSVREVIETARTVTHRAIPVAEQPRRAGDAPVLVANSNKIRRELGWQPKNAELETIIQSAWDWQLQNPHGYAESAND
jgi:UDP-glucose 4-epimerase